MFILIPETKTAPRLRTTLVCTKANTLPACTADLERRQALSFVQKIVQRYKNAVNNRFRHKGLF